VVDGRFGKFTVRAGPTPRDVRLTETVPVPPGAAGMKWSTPLRNGYPERFVRVVECS
jgi:hypothetical protein